MDTALDVPVKVCSRCKIEKPITDFPKHGGYSLGVFCRCRDCGKLQNKETYDRHRLKYIARHIEYNRNHREERNLWSKAWRQKNLMKRREYEKQDYHKNKDRYKRSRLKYEYGITMEEYEDMVAKQNGSCAICFKKDVRLCVDHNHTTGKVRALLCRNCNFAIGLLDENSNLIERAGLYLKQYA